MHRSKDKKHMVISIDAEKAFDKVQHPFMMKLGIEGIYLNIIKTIYDKPIVDGEKLKSFPLKSEIRQGLSTLLLFNIVVLEFLARTVRKEEEIKGTQIGNKGLKLSLFVDDMILYLRLKKLLHTINSFSKVAGYKIILQKSVAFLYINNEHT
jgi:hypothetical protein